ncbi:hypothetical protein JCGZ_08789 [Jatropha curcas]|uniref:Uncharacterized protein n=1 Tax=Jatropha curcas TaxID=180498 RepID=A0A067KV49_JATCU|nr:hypothetical protein JCGZ_08789 [Jatropha curcas]
MPMATYPTERLNLDGQGNTYGEANQQSPFVLPSTTDPQVGAALAQAYSQFTTVLKCLLENPQPNGKPIPPTRLANPPHQEHSLPQLHLNTEITQYLINTMRRNQRHTLV